MATEGDRIGIVVALSFAQRRANKACYKRFRIAYRCTEVLTCINYVIALYKSNTVGLTVVLNATGVAATHRPKFKRYMERLQAEGYISLSAKNSGVTVAINPLGYQVIEYYEQQFYAILQAGETKYKKRLKYGYLPELPIPKPE